MARVSILKFRVRSARFSRLAVLTVLLAACAAPTASPTPFASPVPSSTRPPAAAPTQTSVPTEPATPTAAPSPSPEPSSAAISPTTLAQLRPLWVLDEPGNPNAESGCQDTACWMASRIGAYAFSPDGRTLAVGVCTVDSTENTTNPRHYRFNCDGPAEVRLYQSATGDLTHTLAVGDFPLSLAFHPSRPMLAVGMAHRSLEVWDLGADEKVQTLLHSTTHDGVYRLSFSPDGATLISAGDGRLQLWQWERGLPAGIIENAGGFSFHPAGGPLATLFWSERGDYAEARFYPLDDLERFRAFRLDWRKSPSRVVYAPDGSVLIALGASGLELLDPQTGRVVGEAEADGLLRSAGLGGYTNTTSEVTGDGRLVITATVQGANGDYLEGVGLWDPGSDRADVRLLTFEEQEFQVGEAFFPGFGATRLTLAPGDSFLAARDVYSGVLWIWGIDPAAPADGVSCLGSCGS